MKKFDQNWAISKGKTEFKTGLFREEKWPNHQFLFPVKNIPGSDVCSDRKQVTLDEIMTRECRRRGNETSMQAIVLGNENLRREAHICNQDGAIQCGEPQFKLENHYCRIYLWQVPVVLAYIC